MINVWTQPRWTSMNAESIRVGCNDDQRSKGLEP